MNQIPRELVVAEAQRRREMSGTGSLANWRRRRHAARSAERPHRVRRTVTRLLHA